MTDKEGLEKMRLKERREGYLRYDDPGRIAESDKNSCDYIEGSSSALIFLPLFLPFIFNFFSCWLLMNISCLAFILL